MAREMVQVNTDKNGKIIWVDKSGKVITGIKKVQFTDAAPNQKQGLNWFYQYQSDVMKDKAAKALITLTPEEKLDAQIEKLLKKKENLLKGKKEEKTSSK